MDDLTVEQARDLLMQDPGSGDDANGDGTSPDLGEAGNVASIPTGEVEDGVQGTEGAVSADEDAAEGEANETPARSFVEGSVGLGVDIVEVSRMAAILKRSPAFAKNVFSQAEQDYCNGKANPATHYALRFAAKEAVVKALGTGFSEGIGVRDIEVERAANGKPSVRLSGRALEIADQQGVRGLSISLSYTHTDAVACALAITEASMKATEKRKDPMEELARQFKETRGILDEL